MKSIKTLFVTTLVCLLLATSAHAINLDGHRDKYIHFGGSALCTYTLSKITDSRLFAGLFCFGLGLFKEVVLDSKFDKHDLMADAGGVLTGLILTWKF